MIVSVYKARVGLILPTLTSLADRNERTFLVGLQQWMNFAHKQIRHDLTQRFIKKDVTTELTDWEFIGEQGKEILKPTTLKIMQTGGSQAYKILQAQVSFDVLNPEAVKAAERFCGKLVREVTGETKKGIRSYIKAGVKEGKSMDKIARDLKPLVGLTANQTQSVVSYRNWLNEKRPELSATQVDKRVMTYSNKTHRRRMQTIARTETARAQNIGYTVGLEDLGVDQVEFQVHPDDKTCPECFSLDGKKFKVGEGGDLIPVHPNCRCCLLPVVADTPTCKMAKRMEKATCIPPDSLHDEQIKDLLKKLEAIKVPAEGRKLRRALRRLGHKGGLGGKPPIGVAPKVKPTVPTTVKPKLRPKKPIVPEPSEKLFEATNIGKAEANTRRILGIPITDVKARKAFSFKGVDVEAANHINRGLYNFKQKFPQMKLDAIQVGGKGKNIYAEVVTDFRTGRTTLVLDGKSFKDYKALSRAMKRSFKTNYLVGDCIENLIAHEMGHVLNYRYLAAKYGSKAVHKIRRLEAIWFRQKGLSKYATANGSEGLSEVFSKYIKTGSLKGMATDEGGIESIKRILRIYAGVEL